MDDQRDHHLAIPKGSAESGGGVTTELVEDKPGPIDVLTPGQTKKLLKGMQEFFPYRGAPAGKFGGHYDVLRRLTLSLWRGIGDQKLFEMWLQDWDDKSDWSDLNGGSMVGFAQSLAKSDTGDDKVAPWKAAWKLATENGWKPPGWALPPRVRRLFDDGGRDQEIRGAAKRAEAD